jgi:hypothetical protein
MGEATKMIFTRSVVILVVFMILAFAAACTQPTVEPTPIVKIETVIVKETVPVTVEKEVQVVVTREVEKEVEKEVTVIKTVEVEKEVTVIKTVEVEKEVTVVATVEVPKVVTVEVQVTPTPTLEPTADRTSAKVRELLSQITLVQHHYDPDTQLNSFTCASRGQGLAGIKVDPRGPRFIGPNAGDFDLWGAAALFKISPDGTVELVTQQSGGKFTDLEGIEHESFSREQALELFASGDAKWLGTQGEAGRIGDCDPQYKTPTPEG